MLTDIHCYNSDGFFTMSSSVEINEVPEPLPFGLYIGKVDVIKYRIDVTTKEIVAI